MGGGQLTVMDPYEKQSVYVAEVGGRGEGLFAKRDFADTELIAYYSGIIYRDTDFDYVTDNRTNDEW